MDTDDLLSDLDIDLRGDKLDTICSIDVDLDFDLADFDLIDDEQEPRILKPRINKSAARDMVKYKYAKEMAAQVDLSRGKRTIAIVPGNFIFGDLIEALILDRGIDVRRLYISTLGMSEDNVDSLKNIMLFRPKLEYLGLLLSAYFYSHYKADLVPYLYDELDSPENRFQVRFTNTHMKICLVESGTGAKYVMTGSANLRSSSCLEQFEIEKNAEMYDFYESMFRNLLDKYATIDFDKPILLGGKHSWQAVAENGKG